MTISIDTHKHPFMYNAIMYRVFQYKVSPLQRYQYAIGTLSTETPCTASARQSFIFHSSGKWQAFQWENLKTKNRIQNSFNHLHSCHHLFNFIKSILYSVLFIITPESRIEKSFILIIISVTKEIRIDDQIIAMTFILI